MCYLIMAVFMSELRPLPLLELPSEYHNTNKGYSIDRSKYKLRLKFRFKSQVDSQRAISHHKNIANEEFKLIVAQYWKGAVERSEADH